MMAKVFWPNLFKMTHHKKVYRKYRCHYCQNPQTVGITGFEAAMVLLPLCSKIFSALFSARCLILFCQIFSSNYRLSVTAGEERAFFIFRVLGGVTPARLCLPIYPVGR